MTGTPLPSFGSFPEDDQLRLIGEAEKWARESAPGQSGGKPLNDAAKVLRAAYLASVGGAFSGVPLQKLPEGIRALLKAALAQVRDPRVVSMDGTVQSGTLLYVFTDEIERWRESDSIVLSSLGNESRLAWDAVISSPNPEPELGLSDVGYRPDAVSLPLPEPSWPRGRSTDDLVAELEELTGLASVKSQVKADLASKRVNAERVRRGLPVVKSSMHMVFSGNPGTGKTTVARLLAELYHSAGILSKGQLLEVGPGDLLGRYQGENRQRAQAIIDKALGGVLLVDEAYSLAGTDRGPTEFGKEVIDTLVKGMEDHRHDLVVVFTGYSGAMEQFLQTNPGLESRVGEWIEFPDYTTEQLLEILDDLISEYRMTIDAEGYELIAQTLNEMPRNDRFGNARLVRNVFEDLVARLNLRLNAAELQTLETSELNKIGVDEADAVRDDMLSGRASQRRPQFGFLKT